MRRIFDFKRVTLDPILCKMLDDELAFYTVGAALNIGGQPITIGFET